MSVQRFYGSSVGKSIQSKFYRQKVLKRINGGLKAT